MTPSHRRRSPAALVNHKDILRMVRKTIDKSLGRTLAPDLRRTINSALSNAGLPSSRSREAESTDSSDSDDMDDMRANSRRAPVARRGSPARQPIARAPRRRTRHGSDSSDTSDSSDSSDSGDSSDDSDSESSDDSGDDDASSSDGEDGEDSQGSDNDENRHVDEDSEDMSD